MSGANGGRATGPATDALIQQLWSALDDLTEYPFAFNEWGCRDCGRDKGHDEGCRVGKALALLSDGETSLCENCTHSAHDGQCPYQLGGWSCDCGRIDRWGDQGPCGFVHPNGTPCLIERYKHPNVVAIGHRWKPVPVERPA